MVGEEGAVPVTHEAAAYSTDTDKGMPRACRVLDRNGTRFGFSGAAHGKRAPGEFCVHWLKETARTPEYHVAHPPRSVSLTIPRTTLNGSHKSYLRGGSTCAEDL
ncbi:hypothetical protein U9M48_015751 [Paspalum notatum var. saurae]|uniref:Uncharacterized protein n=1 Tax=Paspalum notatum var. saurae TaxID=547442 RepID=A0AAQ3T3Q3_PASNO